MAKITDYPKLYDLVIELTNKLALKRNNNLVRREYANGTQNLKNLKISLDTKLGGVGAAVGWAGTAVNTINDRLQLTGFSGGEKYGVQDIYFNNNIDLESNLVHETSLTYGTGFNVIGLGDSEVGEPNELITFESAFTTTGNYNKRKRRMDSAITIIYGELTGVPEIGTLYLEDRTIVFNYQSWEIEQVIEHNFGFLQIVPLPNNPSLDKPMGRSEITPTVMGLVDSAMRTMAGMEISREFYSAPQRYVLGANKKEFLDKDGKPINTLAAYMGKMLVFGQNESQTGNPTVGQFTANSPQPSIDMMKWYIQMFSAETSIPSSYLGYNPDGNPSAADAIVQAQAPLISKVEKRQKALSKAWIQTMKLAVLVREGEIPQELNQIRCDWKDAATPTQAATTDAVGKQISFGILQPDSEVTYNKLGYSESDKRILREEASQRAVSNVLTSAQTIADKAKNNPVVQQMTNRIQ